ncbi:hypothetical protein [Kitasatospora aureofaciens]|uniref:hypothetical protein n=1 Tax=Kitasatospora aureofaciens TaxID=1894 RepID=UPI002108F744|nr:hypothetical protein [Kitasatospora aureofaciens]
MVVRGESGSIRRSRRGRAAATSITLPAADAAIGTVARLAVDGLRIVANGRR